MSYGEDAAFPHRVIVVGPTCSRGGITSVISAHSKMDTWKRFGCGTLNTFTDSGLLAKLTTAARAYLSAPGLVRGCSIVHIHIGGCTSMARKLPLLILAKLMAKCTVVHVHTPSIAELVDHRPNWLFPLTCQLADRLVALSPRWARELRAAGASTPITVISNPVSIPKLPAPCDDNGGRKNVLFVGKLEPRKGYADLIRAAAIVLKTAPETEFFLVGHGEIDEARRLARRLGIEKAIRLTGWQEGGALTALYQTATVFCLPSYDEGLPMSVLEAMGWSLPVVTTAVGGIPDVVVDGHNGLFVLPGQINELAASLLAVLRLTPADRNRMGAAARATVLRDCDPAQISLILGELYDELLEHRSSAALTQ